MSDLFKGLFLFLVSACIPLVGAFLVVYYRNRLKRLEFERYFDNEKI